MLMDRRGYRIFRDGGLRPALVGQGKPELLAEVPDRDRPERTSRTSSTA